MSQLPGGFHKWEDGRAKEERKQTIFVCPGLRHHLFPDHQAVAASPSRI